MVQVTTKKQQEETADSDGAVLANLSPDNMRKAFGQKRLIACISFKSESVGTRPVAANREML